MIVRSECPAEHSEQPVVTLDNTSIFKPRLPQPLKGARLENLLAPFRARGKTRDFLRVRLQADDLSATITGDPAKLEFEIDGAVFKPFFETYSHHSVYMDVELVMDDR